MQKARELLPARVRGAQHPQEGRLIKGSDARPSPLP